MVRIWPWTKFEQMEKTIAWYRERENYLLFRMQLHENIALKSMREMAGAHKGIRRLKDRQKRLRQGGSDGTEPTMAT